MRPHFLLFYCNRSPAPHFRPIRPPGIANYSQEISLNEPGALDERLRTLVMQSFEGGGERLRFLKSPVPKQKLIHPWKNFAPSD